MSVEKGNSLLETKRKNRILIKDMIFHSSAITRVEVAKRLDLTLPTITACVKELLSEGILEEIKPDNEKSGSNMGRKPSAIMFKAGALTFIGIELGPYSTKLVLMDIKGNIVSSLQREKAEDKYEDMLEMLKKHILSLLSDFEGLRLLGIGIGLPGFIDSENGVVMQSFRKDWEGRELAKDLGKLLGMKVIIDNNVRLRAVGYEMSGKDRQAGSFAYLYISKGIACPVVIKDKVISGHNCVAGELGHTLIGLESGEYKSLDELGSEKAIFEKCIEKLKKGELPRLQTKLERDAFLNIESILELQEEGDAEIIAIVEESLKYISIALANVINLINPELIIIDGYMMRNRCNRDTLLDLTEKNLFCFNGRQPRVVFSDFDEFYGAKGAAYFGIRKFFIEV